MKKILIFYFLLAITVSLQVGCKKNDNLTNQGSTTNSTVIMPLKNGNKWIYRGVLLDTLGNVQYTQTLTYYILRDTSIQQEDWYFYGTDSSSTELFTNRSDGLWYMRIAGPDKPSQIPVLYAKYPASVDESWLGPDTLTIKLVGDNVGVQIGQATYGCGQYQFSGRSNGIAIWSMYFFPRIGLMKDEMFSKTQSGRTFVGARLELMEFTLN